MIFDMVMIPLFMGAGLRLPHILTINIMGGRTCPRDSKYVSYVDVGLV